MLLVIFFYSDSKKIKTWKFIKLEILKNSFSCYYLGLLYSSIIFINEFNLKISKLS